MRWCAILSYINICHISDASMTIVDGQITVLDACMTVSDGSSCSVHFNCKLSGWWFCQETRRCVIPPKSWSVNGKPTSSWIWVAKLKRPWQWNLDQILSGSGSTLKPPKIPGRRTWNHEGQMANDGYLSPKYPPATSVFHRDFPKTITQTMEADPKNTDFLEEIIKMGTL